MPLIPFKPYWQTTDHSSARLYLGDVLAVLRKLPSRSVQTVVTSPPYWGLRDYGADKSLEIGSERTPEEFVEKLVAVFRELRRVLRIDGTCWLNLGDSYNANIGKGFPGTGQRRGIESGGMSGNTVSGSSGLAPGNLVGIPWRVAFALQRDGWILRQDIIWHKPSPMPESVTNRCTKAHEYVFLLAQTDRYFYDAEAIKEKASQPIGEAKTAGRQIKQEQLGRQVSNGSLGTNYGSMFSNKRSVWTISSEPYSGAHFATFPSKLVEPCIKAGTSEYGACAECGAPWKRVLESKALTRERPNDYVKRDPRPKPTDKSQNTPGKQPYSDKNTLRMSTCANSVAGVESRTVGWEPSCSCGIEEVRPCVVLDPFCGSGTTVATALDLGRWGWGIDLSEKYLLENAIPRIEGMLYNRPATTGLVPRRGR